MRGNSVKLSIDIQLTIYDTGFLVRSFVDLSLPVIYPAGNLHHG